MSFRCRLASAGALAACVALPACSVALDFDATSAKRAGTSESFCGKHLSPPALFCDDFDSAALSTKWPVVEQSNGSAKDDDGAAQSAPNSLLSVVQPLAPGEGARAIGAVTFPSLASAKVGLRISFALRVDDFDESNGASNVVFNFLYGPLDDYNEISLNLVSTESAVSLQIAENAQKVGEEPGEYAQHGPFTKKVARGEWMRVDIDLDIDEPVGPSNALRVSFDGKTELDTSLMLALKGGTPRLELGVGWVDSTNATQRWVVRYDDFVVEAVARR
ncbi:MAG TPA: hypothetical protein VEQ59_09720 [Polyangiaceae bacterium]|nr:hypothetical protein [Polyangiaceae bacterium]